MFKNFFLKKMVERQLANVPEAERKKIMKIVSENPELFGKIALEVQAEVKKGKPQQAAMMEVMRRHQEELRKATGQ